MDRKSPTSCVCPHNGWGSNFKTWELWIQKKVKQLIFSRLRQLLIKSSMKVVHLGTEQVITVGSLLYGRCLGWSPHIKGRFTPNVCVCVCDYLPGASQIPIYLNANVNIEYEHYTCCYNSHSWKWKTNITIKKYFVKSPVFSNFEEKVYLPLVFFFHETP